MTITNTNFDPGRIIEMIEQVLATKRCLVGALQQRGRAASLGAAAHWDSPTRAGFAAKAYNVGVLQTQDVEVRALRETILYGLKGIAAYAHHASMLGARNAQVDRFTLRALAAISHETDVEVLFELALATGEHNLTAMALLDAAHANRYGTPQPRMLSISVGPRPGILVSGHDLLDLQMLLEQTENSGIDVYTHGEMIAGHYYPELFKYPHLVSNYGNAWWRQDVEFARFNGPIVMTSNCIIPVTDAYEHRIFTTGVAGYPGVAHIDGHSRLNPQGLFRRSFNWLATARRPAPSTPARMPGGYNHAPAVEHAGTAA